MKLGLFCSGIFLISSANAFAGGSSTVGPGAPKWRYSCHDASRNLSVVLMRLWPAYDRDVISVHAVIPSAYASDGPVQEENPGIPGAPTRFVGRRFELSVSAAAPAYRDGRAFLAGSIADLGGDPSVKIAVECEVVGTASY